MLLLLQGLARGILRDVSRHVTLRYDCLQLIHISKKSVGRPQKGREAFVPEQLEEKNVYVKIQDAKLELYAPLLHIITAQCMDYFFVSC